MGRESKFPGGIIYIRDPWEFQNVETCNLKQRLYYVDIKVIQKMTGFAQQRINWIASGHRVFCLVFLGKFLGELLGNLLMQHKRLNKQKGKHFMKKRNYKGRCVKLFLSKCQGTCRTYNPVQETYANQLQADIQVRSFQCNVELENSEFTTDFLITMNNGTLRIRECAARNLLTKPHTIKLLDESLSYWKNRGIEDWKVLTDAEKERPGKEQWDDLVKCQYRIANI